jgi:hypothetical protein
MDTVFTPASTQQDVFNQAEDLITSVTDGYNVCIFAYGQVQICCPCAMTDESTDWLW